MPQIPVAPVIGPGNYPLENPRAAGAPYAEVEQSASETARLAQYGMETARVVQRAEDHVVTLKAENQINAEMDAALNGFSQRTDYQAFGTDAERQGDTIRKKFEGDYSGNPRVWRALEPYLDSQIQGFKQSVEKHRLNLLTEDGQAELLKSRDAALMKWAQAPTGEDKEMVRNDYFLKVLDAENKHVITRSAGEKLREGFDIDGEKTEVIHGLRSLDPSVVASTLDSIENHSFKALEGKDPEWLAAAEERGRAWLETVSTKAQKKLDEVSVNRAIGDLERRWTKDDSTMDFAGAFKDLHNPNYQRENFLTDAEGNPDRKRIAEVESYLKGRENEFTQAKKDDHDKYEKQVSGLFIRKKYGDARKALLSSDNPLTADEQRTWSDAIDRKLKKTDEDVTPGEQAAEYLRISQMIDSGVEPEKIRASIIGSDHLKTAVQQRLLDRVETTMEGESKHAATSAHALIRGQIVVHSEFDEVNPFVRSMEHLQASIAEQDFDDWLKKENQQRTARNQPLVSAREAHDHAMDMLPRYQLTIDQKTNAVRQDVMPRGREKSDHPLKGRPAGRYRVDGKIVNWDGNEEF